MTISPAIAQEDFAEDVTSESSLSPVEALQSSLSEAFAKQEFSLRQDGKKPIVFSGHKIASACSKTGGALFYYTLNLYRREEGASEGRYVLEMIVSRRRAHEQDVFYASHFASLEDCAYYLETYDAQRDVKIKTDSLSHEVSGVELALQGIILRQRMDEAKRAYNSAIGDLLTALSA
jgi:hypothetical protein